MRGGSNVKRGTENSDGKSSQEDWSALAQLRRTAPSPAPHPRQQAGLLLPGPGAVHRDVTSVRAWPRFVLRGPRAGVQRWQLREEAAREAVELKPGPIPASRATTLILQRTEKRNRPDGPLSPSRGPCGAPWN